MVYEIVFIDGNRDECIGHFLGSSKREAEKNCREEFVVTKIVSCKKFQ